jgi:hypothetical protein
VLIAASEAESDPTKKRHVAPSPSADGYKEILQQASELAKVMVPERRPEAQLYDPPAKYLRRIGPWLADHPKKPPGFGLPRQ